MHAFGFKSAGLVAALFIIWLDLSACQALRPQATPQTDPCDDAVYLEKLKQAELLQDQLRNQLEQYRAKVDSLQSEVHKSQIDILEMGALIRQRDNQISHQQQTIDEAVVEVVRAKAKLRSIESRAEAASTMAETEIALKGLKKQNWSGTDDTPGQFDKAESLLKMSAEEFRRENYGGALYLSGQARLQIKAIQNSRNQGAVGDMLSGEVVFNPPLPLRLQKRSNLRKTPDLQSHIMTILETGTPIIGHSHKDDWIRIQTESGISGWVHQSLIQGR